MADFESSSITVDDPAKLPPGGSDISPLAVVELDSTCVCSYCRKTKPQFKPHENWCERIFIRRGIIPKIPLCRSCAHQIKAGRVIAQLSESDLATRTLVESIKSRAHFISVRGGSLDELRVLISELESSSGVFLQAVEAFKAQSLLAAEAAAKVEWIRKVVANAKTVIEAKTRMTYAYCRRVADRAISDPQTRKLVFERAEYRCEICKATDFLSVDHVKSVKAGGANTLENYQCLCISCNSRKGA